MTNEKSIANDLVLCNFRSGLILIFSRLPLGLFLETPPNFSDRPKPLLSGHAASPLGWAVPDILGSVPREIASEFLK